MATVWVKRAGEAGVQYVDLIDLDMKQLTVSRLKDLWLVREKDESAAPGRVTLKLVRKGVGKPTAEEEDDAQPLEDPSLSLEAAGVEPGSWLLAVVLARPTGMLAATPPAVSARLSDNISAGFEADC